MRTLEFTSPKDSATIEKQVESLALRLGLESKRGTLKSCPGCTHWHFRPPNRRGTLELTWWPQKNRLWIKVAANRESDWIDEAIAEFVGAFGVRD